MTVDEIVYQTWINDPEALALVPVERFRAGGLLDTATLAMPYVIFTFISEVTPTWTHSGLADLSTMRYQFSVYSATWASAAAVLIRLRRMHGAHNEFQFQFQGQSLIEVNTEYGYIHSAVDFFISYPEPAV